METIFNSVSNFVHSQAGYIFSGILFGVVVTLVMLLLLRYLKNFTAPVRYSAWWLVLIAVIAFPVVASVTAYSFFSSDSGQLEKVHTTPAPVKTFDDNQIVEVTSDEPLVLSKTTYEPKQRTFIYRPDKKAAQPMLTASVKDPLPPKAHKTDFAKIWYSFIPFIFMLAWGTIASFMILRIARAYLNILKLKKHAIPYDIDEFSNVQKFIDKNSLRRKVSVCLSNQIEVPIAAGLGKAVVLIPTKLAAKLSDNEIEIIILHELAHLARWDDWSNLGQKLIGAINFYHPAVHWICKQIDLNREIACDNMVVEHTGNPKKYAECLTHIMQLTVGSGTTLMSNAYTGDKQIFKRFESILLGRDKSSDSKLKLRLISVCVVVMLMAFTFLKVSPVIAFPGSHLTYSDLNEGITYLAHEFGRDEEPTAETVGEGSKPLASMPQFAAEFPEAIVLPEVKFDELNTEQFDELMEDLSEYRVELSETDLENYFDNNVYFVPPVPAAPAVPGVPSVTPSYPIVIGNGTGYYYYDNSTSQTSHKRSNTNTISWTKGSRVRDLSSDRAVREQLKENSRKSYQRFNEQLKDYSKALEGATTYTRMNPAAIAQLASSANSYAFAVADHGTSHYRGRPKRGLFDGLIDWTTDLFSGRYSGTIHSDDDGEKTIMWSDGSNIVGMKLYGDVTFTDDDRAIKSIEDDGYATIFEKTRRNKVELDIFINDDGELEYYYLVNREEQEFDAEAKEWYADIVYEVITKTGVGADKRAARIYKQGGLSAVMDALDEIESSYVKSLYFEYLIQNEKLTHDEYSKIMLFIERDLDSDYEKAELLIAMADVAQSDHTLINDYIDVVKSLESDYEIKRVLTEIDFSNTANRDNLIEIMGIIDYMDSDYEKAELLVEIAPACQEDNELKQAYIEKLHAIDSDYELRRIFSALGRKTDFDKNSLTELLTLAESLDSDYEKAEFLYDLSSRIDNDPALMMILVNATGTIDSDYEKRKVLTNLYDFSYDCVKDEKLIRAQLEIVEKFDSDYEKTQVLGDLAECVGENENLVDDYLYVLRELDSDYEYKRALIYLIKSSDLKKPVVLKILKATEDIDSDYEKSEVLGKLVRTVKGDDDMEDAFIGVLETFSHNSYEADQLYKKLRRSKRYNSDEG